MLKRVVTIAGIMTLAGSSLLADFTYQETSTITGGMMMSMMSVAGVFSKQAREPIQSTIAVKGDRMVHRSVDSRQRDRPGQRHHHQHRFSEEAVLRHDLR